MHVFPKIWQLRKSYFNQEVVPCSLLVVGTSQLDTVIFILAYYGLMHYIALLLGYTVATCIW